MDDDISIISYTGFVPLPQLANNGARKPLGISDSNIPTISGIGMAGKKSTVTTGGGGLRKMASEVINLIDSEDDEDDDGEEGRMVEGMTVRGGLKRTSSMPASFVGSRSGEEFGPSKKVKTMAAAAVNTKTLDLVSEEDDDLPDIQSILGGKAVDRTGVMGGRASSTSSLSRTKTFPNALRESSQYQPRPSTSYLPDPIPLFDGLSSLSANLWSSNANVQTTNLDADQSIDVLEHPLGFGLGGGEIGGKKKKGKGKEKARYQDEDEDGSETMQAQAKKPRLSEEAKAEEKRLKEEEKAKKKAMDEAIKNRRLLERKANVKKRDRRTTLAEITIELHPSLMDPKCVFSKAIDGLRTKFAEFGCKVEEMSDTGHGGEDDPLNRCLHWKRETTSDWNEERKVWVPRETRTVMEHSAILFVAAKELEDLIVKGSGGVGGVIEKISKVKEGYRSRGVTQIFLMIDGLNAWYRKKNNKNQGDWQARARAELNGYEIASSAPTGSRGGRSGGGSDGGLKQEEIESELMKTQIIEKCQIVRVEGAEDIGEWMYELTSDIGFRPYKILQKSHSGALQIPDKMPTGKDNLDTYIKMLTCIHGVTESMAKGIAAEYKTLRILYEAWDGCRSPKEREDMLIGCSILNNKDGTASNRRIGNGMSRRIHSAMRSRDPFGMVVD